MDNNTLERAIASLEGKLRREREALDKLKEFRNSVNEVENQYNSTINARKNAVSVYYGCTTNTQPNKLYLDGVQTRLSGITAGAVKLTFGAFKIAINLKISAYSLSIGNLVQQIGNYASQLENALSEEAENGN